MITPTSQETSQTSYDYDDLLVYLKALLQANKQVRERLSRVHRYIMVDEYQDTNMIQADIVRLLADTHDNVMVVGDDSQCIYGFRGANFGNIMDFPDIFPGTKLVKLEENYRSAKKVYQSAFHAEKRWRSACPDNGKRRTDAVRVRGTKDT